MCGSDFPTNNMYPQTHNSRGGQSVYPHIPIQVEQDTSSQKVKIQQLFGKIKGFFANYSEVINKQTEVPSGTNQNKEMKEIENIRRNIKDRRKIIKQDLKVKKDKNGTDKNMKRGEFKKVENRFDGMRVIVNKVLSLQQEFVEIRNATLVGEEELQLRIEKLEKKNHILRIILANQNRRELKLEELLKLPFFRLKESAQDWEQINLGSLNKGV